GGKCTLSTDCLSKVCGIDGKCGASTCPDGKMNGDETGVDCGGSCTTKCGTNVGCKVTADCNAALCVAGTCAAATCSDLIQNGGEADVDCSGPCSKCDTGGKCTLSTDC
ncbi:unnamed protein product, partial [Adineta steineri]